MTWVKLDDSFAQHPKVIGLSDAAFRLHIEGLCWSAKYLTDGLVPTHFVGTRTRACVSLVSGGLWSEVEGGYVIHDFLVYQKSKADVLREREAVAARLRRFRGSTNPTSNATSNATSNPTSNSVPVPVPVPVKQERKLSSDPSYFIEFWKAYPRSEEKKAAKAKFDRIIDSGEATPEEVVKGAIRFRDDPNREDRYTKIATTWLNRGCWNDPPLPPREGRAPPVGSREWAERLDKQGGGSGQDPGS